MRVNAHDTRRFGRPIAARERCSKSERHFAKYGARNTPAQGPFDAVDEFDDLYFAGDDGVQCTFSTFRHGKFSGSKVHVGGNLR